MVFLTQQQLCSLAADVAETSQPALTQAQAITAWLLTASEDGLTVSGDSAELIDLGFVNEKGMIKSYTFSDDAISNKLASVARITITYDNPVYPEEVDKTILGNLRTSTILEALGSPFMAVVLNKGYATIRDYAMSIGLEHSGSYPVEYDLVIIHDHDSYTVGHMACDTTSTYTFTWNTSFVEGSGQVVIRSVLNAITTAKSVSNAFVSACRLVCAGVSSMSDFAATMASVTVNSTIASQAFVNELISDSFASISALTDKLTSFFTTEDRYTVNSDGSITWKDTPRSIQTSIMAGLGGAIASLGEMLGTIMMYAGSTLVKALGGGILLAGSIVRSLAEATASLTGTKPEINTDAVDYTYADAVASGRSVDVSYINHDSELYRYLSDNGRAKVITPSFILFFYNYDVQNQKVDFKMIPQLNQVDSSDQHYIEVYPNVNLHNALYPGWHDCTVFGEQSHYGIGMAKRSGADNVIFDGRSNWFSSNVFDGEGYFPNILVNDHLQYNIEVTTTDILSDSVNANDWKALWVVLGRNVLKCLELMVTPWFNPAVTASVGLMASGFALSYINVNANNLMKELSYLVESGFDHVDGYADLVNNLSSYSRQPSAYNDAEHNYREKWWQLYSVLYNLGMAPNYDDLELREPVQDVPSVCIGEAPDPIAQYKYITNPYFLSQTSDPYYSNWLESPNANVDYKYVLPLIYPDKQAYVTPPEHDLKTVLYTAVVASVLVVASMVAYKVVSKVVSRRIRNSRLRKGQELLREGQTFGTDKGFTDEELAQLSPEDRKTYNKALNKYRRKVKVFNTVSELLGTSTIDWVNNWWNEPTSVFPSVNTNSTFSNNYSPQDIIDSISYDSTGSPQTINPDQVRSGAQEITLVDVYNAITGLLTSAPQK